MAQLRNSEGSKDKRSHAELTAKIRRPPELDLPRVLVAASPADFRMLSGGKAGLKRLGVRDHPAAGLMLPLTVQFLVAMLA